MSRRNVYYHFVLPFLPEFPFGDPFLPRALGRRKVDRNNQKNEYPIKLNVNYVYYNYQEKNFNLIVFVKTD